MLTDLLIYFGHVIGKPPGYERFVRLILPPKKAQHLSPRLLALRGEPLILADPRTYIGWHLTCFGTYENELRLLMKSILREGSVAIDVGANIGWHALYMAQLVGSSGRVLAFEPNPAVRSVLSWHVALNHFQHVGIYSSALSDVEEVVRFYSPNEIDPDCGDGFVLGESDIVDQNVREISTGRLDAILSDVNLHRLDLIKLDIEGYEYRALLGAELILRQYRPIIVMEFNEQFLYRARASRQMMDELLSDLRYSTFILSRSGCEAVVASEWPSCCELVAIPQKENA